MRHSSSHPDQAHAGATCRLSLPGLDGSCFQDLT
jgi:hypothetical protein